MPQPWQLICCLHYTTHVTDTNYPSLQLSSWQLPSLSFVVSGVLRFHHTRSHSMWKIGVESATTTATSQTKAVSQAATTPLPRLMKDVTINWWSAQFLLSSHRICSCRRRIVGGGWIYSHQTQQSINHSFLSIGTENDTVIRWQ